MCLRANASDTVVQTHTDLCQDSRADICSAHIKNSPELQLLPSIC